VGLVSSSLLCLFVLSYVGYLVNSRRRKKTNVVFVVNIFLLLYSFQLVIGVAVFNLYTIKAEIKSHAQIVTHTALIIYVGFTNAHNYV